MAFILATGGSNMAIHRATYGFPATFVIKCGPGPVLPLSTVLTDESINYDFFMGALVFDVLFACGAIIGTTFSIHRWSGQWRLAAHLVFYLVCALLLMPGLVRIPTSLAWLALVGYLFVIPLFFLGSMVFAVWQGLVGLLGVRIGRLAFAFVAAASLILLFWGCMEGI